ncbi:hypothetical protein QJS10_CPB22g00627 [Acorus calamus]|uniref:Uncharacterized protein n=1 Tax=Acorus calamus TaxID=4465 RepID=A0AAV9C1I0_ACOCL|nr:hypothetical protein QJS10_CPB22g00627 [Acorus calamus]
MRYKIKFTERVAGDIPPPFPWATSRRAVIYTLEDILALGYKTIQGEFKCKAFMATMTIDCDF